MDESKLKEARTSLIERVAEFAKASPADLDEIDVMLKLIERIDQLLVNRRP